MQDQASLTPETRSAIAIDRTMHTPGAVPTLDPVRAAVGLSQLSPEVKAAMSGQFPSTTLQQARERLDHAQSDAERRALQSWVSKLESALKAQKDGFLAEGIRNAAKRAEESALRAQERAASLAGFVAETDDGRRTSAELRQAYTEAERLMREIRELAETADLAFTDREKLRGMDTADWQAQLLSRLPALRDRLPSLLGEIPQHRQPVQGGPGDAHWTPPKNVNTAQSLHGHADKIQKVMDAALDALERAERRERLMSGTREGGLSERLPAMHSRS